MGSDAQSRSDNITANISVLTGRFSHDGSVNLASNVSYVDHTAKPKMRKKTVIEMSFKTPNDSNL